MGAATWGGENGLVDGHAYSVLLAVKVTDNEGKPCNIVKIRNPHHEYEWKGDWSDKSEKWTEEWKKKLKV